MQFFKLYNKILSIVSIFCSLPIVTKKISKTTKINKRTFHKINKLNGEKFDFFARNFLHFAEMISKLPV